MNQSASILMSPAWQLALAFACACALVAPAALLKRKRMGYAALLSGLCMLALAVLWVRGARAFEQMVSSLDFDNAGSFSSVNSALGSGGGGLALGFGFDIDATPRATRRRRIAESRLIWERTDEYPQPYPLSWVPSSVTGFGGFGFYNFHPVAPSRSRTTRGFTLIFPIWFAMAIMSIPPALWFFRRPARVRRQRLETGQCPCCGYDLRAHAVGNPCPECGTPKPAPLAARNLSTATETQGKPA